MFEKIKHFSNICLDFLFSGNNHPFHAAQIPQNLSLFKACGGKQRRHVGGLSNAHFHGAEAAWPQQSAARLEQCYRELEDFKKAYYYACKQR